MLNNAASTVLQKCTGTTGIPGCGQASMSGNDYRLWGQRFFGTISVYGASDFSHFFNMAACPNHSTTSSYRSTVGLTKRSPVIPTQTLSLHNTKYHGYCKYNLTDVYGLCDFPDFLTQQHADNIQKHHATVL